MAKRISLIVTYFVLFIGNLTGQMQAESWAGGPSSASSFMRIGQATPSCKLGDVDGNGLVNLRDALAAARIVTGEREGSYCLEADMNGDGKIGLADQISIMMVLGEVGAGSDQDGDGLSKLEGDCNDADSSIHPGAVEVCGDGIDQDCRNGDEECAVEEAGDPIPDFVRLSSWQSSTSDYQLQASFSPALSVDTASYSLNGGADEALMVTDGSINQDLVLVPGQNRIVLTVADTSGTTYTSAVEIFYLTGLPSSADLIEQAVEDGTIDTETGVVYEVFAAFADPRLPAAYRGEDSMADYSHVLDKVDRLPALSSSAEVALGPYLAPPFYQGSWYDLRSQASTTQATRKPASTQEVRALSGMQTCSPMEALRSGISCLMSPGWASVTLKTNPRVKVWYLKIYGADELRKANMILNLLENQAWPNLKNLMGREPLPDGDAILNGDGPELDVCLVDNLGRPGLTRKQYLMTNHGNGVPAYILLERNQSDGDLRGAAVHEFMHAIQYGIRLAGFDINDYPTMAEGTANWASNFIEKDNQWEHSQGLLYYLHNTNHQLTDPADVQIKYGSYAFFLYLSKKYGDSVIKELWDEAQSVDQLQAMEQVLKKHGTDFEKVWPEFAKTLVNLGPVNDFQTWDKITAGPVDGKPDDLKLDGAPDGVWTASTGKMKPLSILYYRWKLADPNIRSLLFLNGMTFDVKVGSFPYMGYGAAPSVATPSSPPVGAKVQAMIKRDGVWKDLEDWSSEGWKDFCQQKKDKRIEEIVIILSYADISNMNQEFKPTNEEPEMMGSNIFCGTLVGSCSFDWVNDNEHETFDVTNYVMEPEGLETALTPDGTMIYGNRFKLDSGHFSWHRTDQWMEGWNAITAHFDQDITGNVEFFAPAFISGADGYRAFRFMGFAPLSPYILVDATEKGISGKESPTMQAVGVRFTFAAFPGDGGKARFTDDGSRLDRTAADVANQDGTLIGLWRMESLTDP